MSNKKLNVLRLSVSKTKTFLDCKAKYKFSYIEKLPQKDHDYHIFGKFLHKVLEDFHNVYILDNSNTPFNIEMNKAFKGALVEYGRSMSSEMKKECWGIINKYLYLITQDKKNNLSSKIIACEKKFDFEVTDKIILNGMIDRVQIDADNVVHVCDYKSSKDSKFLKKDFFQLLTYAYVMLTENPELKVIRASYIMLRHNFEYITKEFTADKILSIKDQYIKYAEQMINEKEFVPNPTILCRYCDYSDRCAEGKKMLLPHKIYGEVSW
jgi:RecB family exonuclease